MSFLNGITLQERHQKITFYVLPNKKPAMSFLIGCTIHKSPYWKLLHKRPYGNNTPRASYFN